ncbi:alpha-ketoglutarate-dependent 2,4-dichlorophenoxyacetate dioxygenase [Altererythrobacter atlanticus]|uniref:Alpha-ketoglutarate-dependent 2,4-dichlorophenoxyacetate dioxygenase n=1 Tax=Croceibacterium atlanticum TaxID=1267766 RepID=A0A0F7KU64_9SPHN|nr:TauD/TfdA family dioxygenase [Croceibacterium atlanticum]AKH43144.1 Alpha-ketoglutarate-dependent 2,4-dichlorophenoxyacetate dioxygenase [Croceibacterium atlanticum]MBB5732152.1 alpha-ketoglutarate-dependent 2,4-dichlorophenoxyacetate dioxygenase [Croceibacterium atlanticum]
MGIRPLHPLFAAEMHGADFTGHPTVQLIESVERAMARFGVLVIRGADITDEQQKIFSRAFGPLELPSRRNDAQPMPCGERVFDPTMFYAGNLDRDGRIISYGAEEGKLSRGAERFHTDSSFHSMPTKWSLLRGHETPPPEAGGDTWFADTRAAYDALPEELKERIDRLVGLHDFWEGRRRAGLKGEITPEMRRMIPFPAVQHDLVRTLDDGRKSLFIGGHCTGVVGMDEEEGRELVEHLYAHATQDRFIYRHQWRQHDLVIWDNRCTMHAATPLLSNEYRRDMRRTTINESGPEISAFEWMGLAEEG